jgi:uncharacterized coiled-coil protein SlyX
VLVCILCPVATHKAYSQDATCFASYNVKPGRVVIWDLVPGGTASDTTSCEVAEIWREKFYLANRDYLNAVSSGTSAYYVSEIESSIAKTESSIAELEQKIAANESISALEIVAQTLVYEASKADTLLTCAGAKSKVSCVIGLVGVAISTYDILSGGIAKTRFAEIANEQKKQVDKLRKELAKLKDDISTVDMTTIKAGVEDTFFGLCQAVKRDCL